MTLPRSAMLGRYWRRHPPAHLLIAAWLGYKEPEDKEAQPDLMDLLADLPGAAAELA